MNKTIFLILPSILLLNGCSLLRPAAPVYQPLPPVKVITETVELEIYQPPLPPEIQLDDVKFYVVTEKNLDEKIAEIKSDTGSEFVLFGLTPQSYENMAYNLQEIRRYMRQQKEIILYYREATKPKGSNGWLEENRENQANQLDAAQADNVQPEQIQYQQVTPENADGFLQRFSPTKLFGF